MSHNATSFIFYRWRQSRRLDSRGGGHRCHSWWGGRKFVEEYVGQKILPWPSLQNTICHKFYPWLRGAPPLFTRSVPVFILLSLNFARRKGLLGALPRPSSLSQRDLSSFLVFSKISFLLRTRRQLPVCMPLPPPWFSLNFSFGFVFQLEKLGESSKICPPGEGPVLTRVQSCGCPSWACFPDIASEPKQNASCSGSSSRRRVKSPCFLYLLLPDPWQTSVISSGARANKRY